METTLTAAATTLMFGVGMTELTIIAFMMAIPVAIVVVLLLTKRNGSGDTAAVAQDEQILREMNDGLHRMEQRIDALETLLGDEKPKGEQHS